MSPEIATIFLLSSIDGLIDNKIIMRYCFLLRTPRNYSNFTWMIPKSHILIRVYFRGMFVRKYLCYRIILDDSKSSFMLSRIQENEEYICIDANDPKSIEKFNDFFINEKKSKDIDSTLNPIPFAIILVIVLIMLFFGFIKTF